VGNYGEITPEIIWEIKGEEQVKYKNGGKIDNFKLIYMLKRDA
jgi:hypothetical protein